MIYVKKNLKVIIPSIMLSVALIGSLKGAINSVALAKNRNTQSETPRVDVSKIEVEAPKVEESKTVTATQTSIQVQSTPSPKRAQTTQTQQKTSKTESEQSQPQQQAAEPIAPKDPEQSSPQPSDLLGLINEARQSTGLSTLVRNGLLDQASLAKSKHMLENNYFAHIAPDGTDDFSFIKQAGYQYRFAGVNIAKGNFGSQKGLFDAWMNSPGHRANILNSNAREFGYGFAGSYYTMMVGAR